jgi:hypothetical protein
MAATLRESVTGTLWDNHQRLGGCLLIVLIAVSQKTRDGYHASVFLHLTSTLSAFSPVMPVKATFATPTSRTYRHVAL